VNDALQPSWMRPEAAAPRATQRLVAVPWRHPALIVACALVGAATTAALSPRPPMARVVAVRSRVQPILPAPGELASRPQVAGADGPGLRLDLELVPELGVASDTAAWAGEDARVADSTASPLPLSASVDADAGIEALLNRAPPAAGGVTVRALEAPPALAHALPGAALPGLVAGLLLGLLAAAARELRGDRMRSPREAEWALGVPVLGAVPTLSGRARGALLAPSRRHGGAGRA